MAAGTVVTKIIVFESVKVLVVVEFVEAMGVKETVTTINI